MKYIVYKTTNIINNYIYIGVHKTLDPDIFDGYLGCGVYVNIPSTYQYSKTNFQIAVKTFGCKNFKREIIAVFDNLEEAYNLEALLVNEEYLARNDVYNMVLGGLNYGSSQPIKCYCYNEDGFLVNEYSSIKEASTIQNKRIWSAIQFKYKCNNYYWSTDKVEKLDLSNYNKLSDSQPVYRYTLSGKFDKAYDSIYQASLDSNYVSINISRSAKLGYRCGNHQFSFIKEDNYDKAKSEYIKNRPVYKYSITGEYLTSYESQADAENDNPNSNITKSIKTKKPCNNGFLWGLEELPKFCSTKSKKIKIGKFDSKNNLIKTWDSIKQCCADENISRAYITVGKKFKGYYYKHI